MHLGALWDHIGYQGLVVLMFPMSRSGSPPTEFDRDTEKASFPGTSITHGFVGKFALPDTFSSSFNFLRQRKWVNVIPFLMGEQANLLTSSIVD